jgi:ribosomal protein S20
MAASKETQSTIRTVIKGLERRAEGYNRTAHSYDAQVAEVQSELDSLLAKQDFHFAEEINYKAQANELKTLL